MVGSVTVQGRSPASAEVQVVDEDGLVLGSATSNTRGQWSLALDLSEAGPVTLTARLSTDINLESDPISLTVAPVIQPRTGVRLAPEPENERGAAFTALVALLMTAFGFTLIYAGRLIYNMARGRNNTE